MASVISGLIEHICQRLSLRHWEGMVRRARTMELPRLRSLRRRALLTRSRIDRVLFIADERLTLPRLGSNAFAKPLHCDWAWRPELWRGPIVPPGQASVGTRTRFGSEVTLFHDCRFSELTVRQIRNTREADIAPFGLRMDVFNFDGSFVSLAVGFPEAAVSGLKRRHLLRLTAVIETERRLEVFARLNIRHGPNTEQLVQELPAGQGEIAVEFDLACSRLNEKRVEKAWVDLIFEQPSMNQVILRDLTFSRRPRAEF